MGASLRTLIVEGDPSDSFLLCMQLRHLGYCDITLSQSYADANERLFALPRPELVLIDLPPEQVVTVAPLASAIRQLGIDFITVIGRDRPALPAAYDTTVLLTRPAGMSDLIDAINLARRYG
jgi:AmiR/NasT family two-component response regulator